MMAIFDHWQGRRTLFGRGLSMDDLDQILFYFIQWFWRRRKLAKISNLSTTQKPWWPSLKVRQGCPIQFWKWNIQGVSYASLVHNLKKKSKCKKVNGRRTMDAKWWETLTWAFGPGQLKIVIFFFLFNFTFFPCLTAWMMISITVVVLPVPGGPWTTAISGWDRANLTASFWESSKFVFTWWIS